MAGGPVRAERVRAGEGLDLRPRERLWSLVPNVALRSRGGLLALFGAALIGVATSLATARLWAHPASPLLPPNLASSLLSLCGFFGNSSGEEVRFLEANQAAMTSMMLAMNIRPSGDVDRDFVNMMVPHHQGAIDMAIAVLRNGNNKKIWRLAQEIIVTQQQEIAAMRLAVGEPLPPSHPSPTTPTVGE